MSRLTQAFAAEGLTLENWAIYAPDTPGRFWWWTWPRRKLVGKITYWEWSNAASSTGRDFLGSACFYSAMDYEWVKKIRHILQNKVGVSALSGDVHSSAKVLTKLKTEEVGYHTPTDEIRPYWIKEA